MIPLSYTNLGKLIHDFENDYFDLYKKNKLKSWLTWSIVKCPIFFSIYNDLYANSSSKKNTSIFFLKDLFIKIKNSFIFLINLPVFLFKKKSILLFAHDFYKQDKNENGKYYNIFMDGFLETHLSIPFIYIEKSNNGTFKLPSFKKYDLSTDGLIFIIGIIKKIITLCGFQKRNAVEISSLFNYFLEKNQINYKISHQDVKKIIINFYSEYLIYKFLFLLLKPRSIVVHDEIGSGKMAAARKQSIPVIELQHGLLDEYNPYYLFSKKLKIIKESLVIPTVIGIFGDYHKKVVNQTGFWKEEELFSIGNKRIDRYRNVKSDKRNKNTYTLLFISQWNVFKEITDFLPLILQQEFNFPIKLLIKVHPRDTQKQVDWYENLKNATKNIDVLVYREEKNIYDLIIQSDLVIGYNSNLLLESIALGIPTSTITTDNQPKGIHSLLGNDLLLPYIKLIQNEENLKEIVNKLREVHFFYDNWEQKNLEISKLLYEEKHLMRCELLLKNLL